MFLLLLLFFLLQNEAGFLFLLFVRRSSGCFDRLIKFPPRNSRSCCGDHFSRQKGKKPRDFKIIVNSHVSQSHHHGTRGFDIFALFKKIESPKYIMAQINLPFFAYENANESTVNLICMTLTSKLIRCSDKCCRSGLNRISGQKSSRLSERVR